MADAKSRTTLQRRRSSKLLYKLYDIRAKKVMSFEGDDPKVLYKMYDFRAKKATSFVGDGARRHNLEFKGSSHGWLAEFDPPTRDLSLYNPISRRRLKLPNMDTLPLRGEGAIDSKGTEKSSECIVKKVILSSSDPENDESCVAMMLYGADNRLACCHPAARGSRHWQWDDDKDTARSYKDVAYSAREKLFFCLTKDDELEAWDSSTALRADDVMPISIKDYLEDDKIPTWYRRCERDLYQKGLRISNRERYLVVAEPYDRESSQLFLVLPHKVRLNDDDCYDDEDWEFSYDNPLLTVGFDVWKLDVEKRELVHMDRTLGGLALFVGKNHSLSVKADEFDGLKPDSIYFIDQEPLERINAIYNYEDSSFAECYHSCEDEGYEWIVRAPMWFSPLHIDHN